MESTDRMRPGSARSTLSSMGPSRAAVLALILTLAGCSWHRLTPAQVDPPSRLGLSLGLDAEDAETSLSDLKSIGGTLEQWQVASRVQFPWRAGDDVDVLARVGLRQTVERPEGRNFFTALASGLTLFALSCCIGPELSEVHTVSVSFVDRDGVVLGSHSGRVVTTLEAGMGADAVTVAKATDLLQVEQIAKLLTEWLQEDVARRKREATPPIIKRSAAQP